MEDKITLDKAAFKALASETRVSLLKKLGSRRATPSELAASLQISAQAASEHLAQLERAGLVRRDARPEDEGRKWVYYSLTEKGAALVRPSESRKIWVLLSTGALALAVGAWSLLSKQGASIAVAAAPAAQPAFTPQPAAFGAEAADNVAVVAGQAKAAAGTASPVVSVSPSPLVEAGAANSCAACGFPWETFLLAVGCLLVVASAYYYVKTRRSSSFKRV